MVESLFPRDGEAPLLILPLRNSVLFPSSVVPVNVGRERSVRLIEEACNSGHTSIGVVAQLKPEVQDPGFEEIHQVGTVARILKVIRLSSGNYSVVLQGICRMEITEGLGLEPCMNANARRLHDEVARGVEIDALAGHLREATRQLQKNLPTRPRDASSVLDNIQEPGALADVIASNLPISIDAKQEVLETLEIRARLHRVMGLVDRQNKVYSVKKEISSMVSGEMSRTQREYLLRQQMKAIRRQLGENPDDEDEVEALRERVAESDLPLETEKAARQQLKRMRNMSSTGSEYQVARNYVEWLLDLPWKKSTPDRMDVGEARRVLDEDHHGLIKAKRRILEYIAVRRLRADARGPILCFVGPPGVGKTSLARSIARATGRHFERVALGGVGDEAEIRGHRRTYVGAFPGRIVTALKRAGSRNPVMLLDEIDKLVANHRGDPASALLEVLDPEQNNTFQDHYLEVPVDLRHVMFIATANRVDTIPRPLLDRMEMIRLPGYTHDEKRAIANQFLLPRQLSDHGLTAEHLSLTPEGLNHLVNAYTHEAGVRNLERQVGSLCRAVAVMIANGDEEVSVQADPKIVESILGPPRINRQEAERVPSVGLSTGLAWTPAGGELLLVEAHKMPGKGRVQLTGQMGDIMKESAAAAFTYIRARTESLGLDEDFLTKIDVHLHLPEGAIPKDGPSAGIAMFVALSSMLTQLKVRTDVAMTGEITLRGNILRVGAIKEKCLAAHRFEIENVILPKANEADLEEVPEEVRNALKIHLVSRLDQVLELALDMSELQGEPPGASTVTASP